MLGQQAKFNKAVFYPASLVILLLMVVTVSAPNVAKSLFADIQSAITANGSWFYVLTVAIILGFVLYLSLSRFGLMFFGVAEPIMHYLSPPTAEQGSLEAIKEAMKITFFHWGFHA